MKELTEYRQKLMDRLAQSAAEFRVACLAIRNPFEPLEPDGWNAHQVAVHTRDVDMLVYGMRARRTLVDDNPHFPNFDGEAYMAQHYDPNEPLVELLDGLGTSIRSLVDLLSSMPADGWSRLSSHETLGNGLTLQSWVEAGARHLEEHLATLKKATLAT